MLSFNNFFPPNVIAFTSSGSYDFSCNPKGCSLSSLQTEAIEKLSGLAINRVFNIKQVHGQHIVLVDEKTSTEKNSLIEADGIVTGIEDLAIVIRTADCLPVFLFDPKNQCISIVHCGWKSSQGNIIGETLKMMEKNFCSRMQDIRAVLGPAIRKCCYRVGDEFKELFPDDISLHKGDLFFDLIGYNRKTMLSSGLSEENIFDSQECSCCNEKYFSYRRQGNKAGRMISLMMIKKL